MCQGRVHHDERRERDRRAASGRPSCSRSASPSAPKALANAALSCGFRPGRSPQSPSLVDTSPGPRACCAPGKRAAGSRSSPTRSGAATGLERARAEPAVAPRSAGATSVTRPKAPRASPQTTPSASRGAATGRGSRPTRRASRPVEAHVDIRPLQTVYETLQFTGILYIMNVIERKKHAFALAVPAYQRPSCGVLGGIRTYVLKRSPQWPPSPKWLTRPSPARA